MKRKNGSHAIIAFIDSVPSLNPCPDILNYYYYAHLILTWVPWFWSDFPLLLDDDTLIHARDNKAIVQKVFWFCLWISKPCLMVFRQFITVGFIGLHQFTVQLVVCFYFMFHCSSLRSLPCFCMLPILLCLIFQCSCILYVWFCLNAVR